MTPPTSEVPLKQLPKIVKGEEEEVRLKICYPNMTFTTGVGPLEHF